MTLTGGQNRECSASVAIRRLCGPYYAELQSGGMLWFQDLTIAGMHGFMQVCGACRYSSSIFSLRCAVDAPEECKCMGLLILDPKP